MRHVFDNVAIDMLCELHGSFGTAGGTYPTTLAGEGYQERVFASVTVNPGGTVSEDAAVKVLLEGLRNLIS
jgi:hypothetical protein